MKNGGQNIRLRLAPAACCLCEDDRAAQRLGTGEDFEYRTSADSFAAYNCRRCGLVYLNPRPDVSEFQTIYPPTYHAFEFVEKEYGLVYKVRHRLEAKRLLAWCRNLPGDARILDVGCGDGFHLGVLREFGGRTWTLEGVDADERAVRVGRANDLTIHQGTLDTVWLAESSYDLVLLIQTVEHVADPPGLLRRIRALLRPGGRLVVVTDNTDSLDFRLFKKRHWGGYHFPRHWNLFNKSTMRRLAEKTDFEVEKLTTQISPVNWVYSIRNLLTDREAPAWLIERFSLRSTFSLGVFTAFDALHNAAGRGALLNAILKRPF